MHELHYSLDSYRYNNTYEPNTLQHSGKLEIFSYKILKLFLIKQSQLSKSYVYEIASLEFIRKRSSCIVLVRKINAINRYNS